MQTDNLDIFEKIIFHLPSFRATFAGIVGLGFIYSTLMYLSFSAFTQIPVKLKVIPYLAAFLFILPTLLSGEVLHRFLPDYPRKWSYFLALSNELILFIYSLILSGADNIGNAWSIIWLGLITVYISNFLVITLTISTDYIKRISVFSLVQPVAVLAAFHVFLGRYLRIPIQEYILNTGLIMVAMLLVVVTLYTMEYLIGSNVSNVSAFKLTAGLLQKKQEALDLGYPTEVDVQTVSITNQNGNAEIAAPWVHPGPLGGFGGGSLTTDIIEKLNQKGEGFFLHVPSTHKSDPADPADNSKIIDAVEEPEKVSEASRLLKKEYENATFYGRRFNGQKLVFIDIPDYDDYDLAIFRELIDPERTAVVDLHQEDMAGNQKTMFYNSAIADRMRENLRDFMEELEELEVSSYEAGFSTDISEKSFFSLVEEVDGQRTLLFGIEGNGLTDNLRELEEEFAEEFDKVLAFSTDTHTSIHELAKDQHLKKSKVRRIVDKAVVDLSSGSIGLGNQKTGKMKLLQDDYSSLIFSINIIIRLLPITLVLLYLGLIIWVF
jgi:putative membrane protein